MANCTFSHVIVPGDAVFLQKQKQRFSVSLEPLLILGYNLARECLQIYSVSKKSIYRLPMLAQVPCLQTVSLDITENRIQQNSNFTNKLLQFLVERIFPQVVVQVSD
jgi:hypothetical protein